MQLHLRYLFITILWLLSNHSTHTLAQDNEADLPLCAMSCAHEAASSLNCDPNDPLCICPQPVFDNIIQCSNAGCPPFSFTLTEIILTKVCAAKTTTAKSITHKSTSTSTSSSTFSTSSSTSQSETTTTTSVPSTSQTSSASTHVISPSSQTSTVQQLASSTFFIVSTVIANPAPTTTTSAAGRLDVSIGTGALVFGLSSLISLVAAT